MLYLVAFESKVRGFEDRHPRNGWLHHVMFYDDKATAIANYNDHLPGNDGDFGPIEYRNITIAEVLSRHE